MTKEEFVKEVTDGLTPPPVYFPENVMMNKKGYESVDKVLSRGLQKLSAEGFEAAANETEALVLDTRSPQAFSQGFIPNSINIGIDGSFAPWVGALILDIRQPILIVADPGREEEVVTRLARVGYDNTLGYLDGGFSSWQKVGKEADTIENVTADEFSDRLSQQELEVIDVRKPSEFAAEHVEGSKNLALDFINDHMDDFDKEKPLYLYCAGGYRSMIASSILKARGWDNVINIEGGWKAIEATAVPRTDYVCPTTVVK